MSKIARNTPCPCGSGEKYKHCCGALSNTATQLLSHSPEKAEPVQFEAKQTDTHDGLLIPSPPSAPGSINSIESFECFETDRGSQTTESVQLARSLYLDLIERCLINTIYEDDSTSWGEQGVETKFDRVPRQFGRDWPTCVHTMIGHGRLRNLRDLAEQVLIEGVPGDFIETGVGRGGACILLRAILKAHGVTNRRVFAADSFAGLPMPDAEHYPADAGDSHYTCGELAISLEQVKANFDRYSLLDDQVVFLKGWFKDTLLVAPIEKLAILRLDGDMYESTMDALRLLYDKVTLGGFIIIDDYGCVAGCRQAVDDFRRARNIHDTIINIDEGGV